MEQYRKSLIKYAIFLGIHQDYAEDIVQSVFLKTLRNPPALITKAYLRVGVRRKVIDNFRKMARRNNAVSTYNVDINIFPEHGPVCSPKNQEIFQLMDFCELVERLKPREQKLLYYKYVERLSTKELASFFSMSESGIKNALVRIRKKLKKILLGD